MQKRIGLLLIAILTRSLMGPGAAWGALEDFDRSVSRSADPAPLWSHRDAKLQSRVESAVQAVGLWPEVRERDLAMVFTGTRHFRH